MKLSKNSCRTGELIVISASITETVDYPYDYMYDYPVSNTDIALPVEGGEVSKSKGYNYPYDFPYDY